MATMPYCPIPDCVRTRQTWQAFCPVHRFRVPLLTRKALARYQANPRKRGGEAHTKLIAKTIQQLNKEIHDDPRKTSRRDCHG